MSDEILIGVADDVATVTLNRPDKRNAMNAALLRALAAAFDDLDARRDVRVIVVRGAGPAFCSGRDLRDMERGEDRKSTRLNSSHLVISYAVFCLKKKKRTTRRRPRNITTQKL